MRWAITGCPFGNKKGVLTLDKYATSLQQGHAADQRGD
jgi:hypothetical protein